MFCESCGTFISDGQSFCSNCGTPAPAAPAASPAPSSAAPVSAAPVAAAVPVAAASPAPAPAPQPVAQSIPAAQSSQPAYGQPAYQQPVAQPVQPVYQQPVYPQPVYQQPVYTQPQVVVQQPVVQAVPVKKGNGPATAGLVFGILTVVFCWSSYFCGVFALLGLIFSIVGLCKKNAPGKGKAIAGLILTVIGGIAAYLITIFFWAAVGEAWDELYEEALAEYESSYADTSFSGTEIDSDTYYIDGDFVTTDKGYVSGVLHIDSYIVEF